MGSFNSDVDWAFVGLEIKSGSTGGVVPKYSLTVNTSGLGAVDLNPAGGEYPAGTEVELTAVPDSGWSFTGWGGDAGGTNLSTTVIMSEDRNVSAAFVNVPPQQFTLTLTSVGQGTVDSSPPGPDIFEGSQVTLTARPDSGWAFASWSGDAIGSTSPLTFTMDSSMTVLATFEENASPVAVNDAFDMIEDDTLVVAAPGVLANDSDSDGDSLAISLLGSPAHGTLNLGSDGSLSYIPAADSNGVVQMSYTLTDHRGGQDTGQITVTVQAVNDPPVALDDSYQITGNNTLDVAAPGILANDQEVDGDGLTADLDSGPSNGSLALNADGSFSYSANAGFHGQDSFTYVVNDGQGPGATGQVTITVSTRVVSHEETVGGSASESATVSTAEALTPMIGHLYLAAISAKPFREIVSVSGLGLNWTRVRSQCSGRGNTGVEVWAAQGLPSGDGVVTASFSSAPTNAVLAVSRYSGVDPTDAVRTMLSGNTNGSDGACSGGSDSDNYGFAFDHIVGGSIIYGAVGLRNKTHSPGTGFTERAEISQGTDGGGAGVAISDRVADAGTTNSLNGTLSRDVDWAVIGIEIQAGGGGGAVPTYELSVASQGSGTVTTNPPAGPFEFGTEVTLTAQPTSGWSFTGWSGDLGSTVNPATIIMDEDKSVSATFVENAAPNAVDDHYQLSEDDTLIVAGSGVLANDSDSDGDNLTAALVSGPAFGALSLNSGGGFSYSPSPDSNGVVTFVYSANDDKGGMATATVTLTIDSVQDSPVASNDNYNVTTGLSLSIAAPGILSNDTDADGDNLTASLLSGTSNGILTLQADGSFSYTPADGFIGSDSFSYSVSDGQGGSDSSTVTVAVNPLVTFEQMVSGRSSELSEVVTSGPIDPVSGHLYLAAISSKPYREVAQVSGLGLVWTRVDAQCSGRGNTGVEVWMALGSVSSNGAVVASLTGSPNNAVIAVSRYSGVDGDSPVGTIVSGNTIGTDGSCSGGDDQSAYAFALTTSGAGSVLYGAIAMRDKAHSPGLEFIERAEILQGSGGAGAGVAVVDREVASASAVQLGGSFNTEVDWAVIGLELRSGIATVIPSRFSLTVNAVGDGSVTMTPPGGVYDQGSVVTLTAVPSVNRTFAGWSGDLTTSASPVEITMNSDKQVTATFVENVPPVALDDGFALEEDDTLNVGAPGPLSNDTDPDGDALSATLLNGASKGTVSLSGNGAFQYIPHQDASGTDSFAYLASDGKGGTAPATVTLTINAVQDAPVTSNDSYDVTTGLSLSIPAPGVLTNDIDVDGDDLTASLLSGPSSGILTLHADGGFSYTPGDGFVGTDSFIYSVDDGQGGSDSGTATVTVNPILAFEQLVSGRSSEVSEVSISGPIEGVSGHLYLAAISSKPYREVAQVTGLGLVWTRVDAQCSGRNNTGVEVWMALGSVSGNGDVVASLSGSPKNAVITVSRYSGVDGDNPIGAIISGNTMGADGACEGGNDQSAYSFALTTTSANSVLFGAIAMRDKTHSPGSEFVERAEVLQGSGGAGAGVAVMDREVVSASSVQLEGSFNNAVDWAVVGLELRSGTATVLSRFSLTANTVGDGSVTITPPDGVYDQGSIVTLSAIADPNRTFAGWSGDLTSGANPAEITMNSDQVVTATFVENAPPVALDDGFAVEEDDTLNVGAPGPLSNDTDPDGDALSATLLDGASKGTVSLSGNGAFQYIPHQDAGGTDSFVYSASDGKGGTTPATVTLTINSVQDAPVASNDSYDITTGLFLSIAAPGVLSNDSDADGDNLTASLLNGPANGIVSLQADGGFNYTPADGFVGTDFFSYTVSDGQGGSDTGVATVIVNPVVNFEQIISGRSSEASEVSTSGPIDAVSGHLYLAAISSKPYREVTQVAGLGLVWTRVDAQCSGRNNTGVEVWMALGSGSLNGEVVASLSGSPKNAVITVSGYSGIDGDNPIGSIISGNTVGADGTCSGGVDERAYSFTLATTGASSILYGAVAMRDKTHSPSLDFVERAEILQGSGGAGAGMAVVDREVASPSAVQFEGSFSSAVDWAAVALELRKSTAPVIPRFSLTVNTIGNGNVTMTPPGGVYDQGSVVTVTAVPDVNRTFAGWNGDLTSGTSPAEIIMNSNKLVTATFVENAPPVAVDDGFVVEEDDTLNVESPGVLSNDTDPDGDAMSVTVLNAASKGTVSLSSNGALQYTPLPDSSGTDSFVYSASDGKGGRASATVTVTVHAVPEPPVALDDTFVVQEGDTLDILAPGLLANDRDPDGDPLTASFNSGAPNGTLNLNADGSFRYIPKPSFHGTDAFIYSIDDGNGGSSNATVSLTVTDVNDLPIAADDAFSVAEDNTLTVAAPGVLANDSDADGDALTAQVSDGPTNGALTVNNDGSFAFTPDLHFHGSDSFTYTASDGQGGSATGTVTITVNPIADSPVAVDDAFTATSGSPLTVLAPGILANDSDADGDNLQASLATGPLNGSLNLNADGSFIYTPNAGFAGTENLTYTLSDGNGGNSTAAVTIVVSPAEVTLQQTNSGTSSEEAEVSLSGPIRGISGHLYLAAISTKPYSEAVDVSGLSLTWTRVDAQCSGRNNTGVEVWMAQGTLSADDIVTAQFAGKPKNAVIMVSRYSGVGSSQPIGTILSGNTVGLEGLCSGGVDNRTYAFDFATTAEGSVVYGAITMRTRTHSPGDGFEEQMEVLQGSGGSAASLAIVEQTVNPVGIVPLQGSFNSDVDWAVIGVEIKLGSGGGQVPQANLAITTIGNGTVDASPAGGVYSFGTQVLLTAAPDAGWSFAGWGGDAAGASSSITLTMNGNKSVTADFIEVPPVQFQLSTSVSGNGSISLSPTGGEYSAGTQVTLDATADSGWVFAGWTGDLGGAVNPTTLVMDSPKNVVAEFIENAVPVAVDDAFTLAEDNALVVAAPGLLLNDHDPDGDALTVSLAGGPSSGTVSVNGNGSFVYIPAADYSGADLFTYSVSDNKNGAAQASVILTINAVNDSPLAVDDHYDVATDIALSVPAPGVLENDTDADGDALSASLLSGPVNGSLSLSTDGSFVYTPNSGFSGADTFGYIVSDGHGGAATGSVTFTINPARVAYEESATGSSFSSTVVSTSSTLGGHSGNLYLAAVATKPYRAVTGVEGLGLAWTRVSEQCSGLNKTGLQLWRAQGTPAADGVVTATLTSAPKTAVIGVARYSGVDGSNPVGNLISGNSNGLQGACSGGAETDSYSFGFETTVDGSVIFAAITMRERSHTAGAEYIERTELVEKAGGGGASIALMDRHMESAGSTTVSGSFGRSVDWAMIGLEIRPPTVLGRFAGNRRPAAEVDSAPPSRFQLFQNYPNPFNPSTVISYDIPSASKVNLTVYDIKGRTVTTLVDEVKKAGSYTYVWKATDSNDRPVASGVYFYRLKAGNYERSFRMLLVR